MRMRFCSVMLVLAGFFLLSEANAQETRQKKLDKLFEIATDYFEMGRHVEARAKLNALLAADPTPKEAWKLRQAFGIETLNRLHAYMEKGRSLGRGPLELLKRAGEHEQELMLDPARITEIVKAAARNPEENPKNLLDVSHLGQFAVPDLIRFLRNKQNDAARANAAYILVHLGSQVVIPLIEALEVDKDDLLMQQVCRILMDVRPADGRSLPYLKRLAENEKLLGTVREDAKAAIEKITGKKAEELRSASEYFLAEANRYYLDSALVREEMADMQETMWVWDKTADNNRGALARVNVPKFALNDLLAEELVYDGMKLGGENKELFEILLASILMQQASENNMFSAVVGFQELTHPYVKQLRGGVDKWQKRLGRVENSSGITYKNDRVAWAMGPKLLVGVLAKALIDGKDEVAIAAIEGIEKVGQEQGWDMISDWKRPAGIKPILSKTEEKKPEPAKEEAKAPAKASEVKGDEIAVEVDSELLAKKAVARTESHPILAALDSPIPRIRIAAANCLIRIGLPTKHEDYPGLLPVLAEGSREKREVVALVISSDAAKREHFSSLLAKKGVLAITAPGGREGFALAAQYPPKDIILVDESVEEFSQLRNRLSIREMVPGTLLPLTIITIPERVEAISHQFMKKKEGVWVENKNWKVSVRHKALPDDPRVFSDLTMLRRYVSSSKPVVILTNSNRRDRLRLKEMLMLEAERNSRPRHLTELARIRGKKSVLNDIYGIRAAYVNVYLDEELSGYGPMKTVLKLRSDPRTAKVPVAIMSKSTRVKDAQVDFEEFTKDKANVRIVNINMNADDLFKEVNDMRALNPMAEKNYARKQSYSIAERSVRGLLMLDAKNLGLELNGKQAAGLRELVSTDKSATMPKTLRAAAALALGHFEVENASRDLRVSFGKEPKENVDLRVALMEALGRVDKINEYKDVKQAAFNESGYEGYEKIQLAASRALARASSKVAFRDSVIKDNRPNDLRALLGTGGVRPGAVTEGDEPVEDEVVKEVEVKEPEKDDEEDDVKDDDTKKEEDTEKKEEDEDDEDDEDDDNW